MSAKELPSAERTAEKWKDMEPVADRAALIFLRNPIDFPQQAARFAELIYNRIYGKEPDRIVHYSESKWYGVMKVVAEKSNGQGGQPPEVIDVESSEVEDADELVVSFDFSRSADGV